MHIFDNSDIKDILDTIYKSNTETAIKLCWKYIEVNESTEINCICEYIISVFENKKSINDIMKKFPQCEKISFASEIVRLIGALEFGKNDKYKKVSKDACNLVCNLGKEIQNDFEKNLEKEITSEEWMNGAILRGIALNLADFFYKKSDFDRELKMLGVRAVVTNSIMFDDLHFVGPSMIDYADCLSRLKRYEEAKKFYIVILNDFKHFVDNYIDNPLKLIEEDYFSIKSLRAALLSLIEISDKIKDLNQNIDYYNKLLNDIDLILSKSGYEENIRKK
jgi:tetratricopeptide (TPR) repeat protein